MFTVLVHFCALFTPESQKYWEKVKFLQKLNLQDYQVALMTPVINV